MKGYDPLTTFDEASAEGYDLNHVRGDEAATVAFLAELARGGAVLELAIGTGRIALPLAATACASTASTRRSRWWPSCGPNPVAISWR